MQCERCLGVMSYEGFYGMDGGAAWYYPGWRCVHCGGLIDPLIELNRRLNRPSSLNGNGKKNGHRNGKVNGKGRTRLPLFFQGAAMEQEEDPLYVEEEEAS